MIGELSVCLLILSKPAKLHASPLYFLEKPLECNCLLSVRIGTSGSNSVLELVQVEATQQLQKRGCKQALCNKRRVQSSKLPSLAHSIMQEPWGDVSPTVWVYSWGQAPSGKWRPHKGASQQGESHDPCWLPRSVWSTLIQIQFVKLLFCRRTFQQEQWHFIGKRICHPVWGLFGGSNLGPSGKSISAKRVL